MRPSETDLARARYVRTVLAWHDHTQTDLGKVLGITQANASQKLRGIRAFKSDELLAIADAYGLDPGALLRPPELAEVLGAVLTSDDGLLTSPKYDKPQVSALAMLAA